jgi:hypothetical protein
VFSTLAHFIKGGIFFWYGLLTLGRWMGAFTEYGWAWNVKPPQEVVGRWKSRVPSAEFTESFVICLYGASNVFLEHLAAWGGAWSAQDLEHVSITIMFFGGGLVSVVLGVFAVLGGFLLTCDVAWHAGRIQKIPQPPELYRSVQPEPGGCCRRQAMGKAEAIRFSYEPHARTHHSTAGTHDGLSSSKLHGSNHGP